MELEYIDLETTGITSTGKRAKLQLNHFKNGQFVSRHKKSNDNLNIRLICESGYRNNLYWLVANLGECSSIDLGQRRGFCRKSVHFYLFEKKNEKIKVNTVKCRARDSSHNQLFTVRQKQSLSVNEIRRNWLSPDIVCFVCTILLFASKGQILRNVCTSSSLVFLHACSWLLRRFWIIVKKKKRCRRARWFAKH